MFGYWRLRVSMNAREGAMMLTDMSWSESHRERTRIEKWRIWGRDKAKGKDQKKEEDFVATLNWRLVAVAI